MNNILIDARCLQTDSRYRGLGRYTTGMIQHLSTYNNVALLFQNWLSNNEIAALYKQFCNFNIYAISAPFWNHITDKRVLVDFYHFLLKKMIHKIKPDVFYMPNIFERSYKIPQQIKMRNGITSATIHDLIPLKFANIYLKNKTEKKFYNYGLASIKHLDVIFCISNATLNDLRNYAPYIDSNKIYNIGSAIDENLLEQYRPTKDFADAVLAKYNINRPFGLYVSATEQRKNMENLIRAYVLLPDNVKQNKSLVICGFIALEWQIKLDKLMKYHNLDSQDIIITGYIEDKEMYALYSACDFFVFPSLYEGFGLPIVEAMYYGAPVIASNTSSIPEIVRSDAQFNPLDIHEMSKYLYKIYTDLNYRLSLAEYGLIKNQEYRWNKVVEKMNLILKEKLKYKKQNMYYYKKNINYKLAIAAPLYETSTYNVEKILNIAKILSDKFTIDIYTNYKNIIDDKYKILINSKIRIFDYFALHTNIHQYDDIICYLKNDPTYVDIIDIIINFDCILILEDFYLGELIKQYSKSKDSKNDKLFLLEEIMRSHGSKIASGFIQSKNADNIIKRYPINYTILSKPHGVIFLNKNCVKLINKFYPKRLNNYFAYYEDNGITFGKTICSLTENISADFYKKTIEKCITLKQHNYNTELLSIMNNKRLSLNNRNKLAFMLFNTLDSTRKPRIYIDISSYYVLMKKNYFTGIQRFACNTCNAIIESNDIKDDIYILNTTEKNTDFHPQSKVLIQEKYSQYIETDLNPIWHNNDILILLDTKISVINKHIAWLMHLKNSGVKIVSILHDIITITNPELFPPRGEGCFGDRYLDNLIKISDKILCVSITTAAAFTKYIKENYKIIPKQNSKLEIKYFYQGSNFDNYINTNSKNAKIRNELKNFFHQEFKSDKQLIFIVVSTIEPRKRHKLILEAFLQIWQDGYNCKLCFIGRVGWLASDTIHAIDRINKKISNFLFVEEANDCELIYAYKNASCLINASCNEGYALPLIEAAHYGLPLLVSNISVFKEVCKDNAMYFEKDSKISLYCAIKEFVDLYQNNTLPNSKSISVPTIQESAKSIIEISKTENDKHTYETINGELERVTDIKI